MTSRVSSTLAQRRLGVPAILAIIVAAAAPMSVVDGGATSGFAASGLISIPLSYLVIAVLLALWAPGYVSLSHLANAGAAYSYITAGLGKVAGVAAAAVALVGYNMMQLAFYGGFGLAASQFTAALGLPSPWWAWAVAALVAVALLGQSTIDLSGRVLMVLLSAEILIVLVFTGVFVTSPSPAGLSPAALDPAQLAQPSLWPALAIAFAGFVGLESCSNFAEEAKSRASMSRAILLAILAIGVLYALGTWALTVATGPGHIVAAANTSGTDLAFTLAGQRLPVGWVLAGRVLYATSMFAGLLAWHNVANRYFFALGREGALPTRLGAASAAGAPRVASLTQTGLGVVVLVVMLLTQADPMQNLFYWGSAGGAVAILILLVGTGIGVLAYHRRSTPVSRAHPLVLVSTALGVLGLTLVLIATLAQFHTLLGTDPGAPAAWIIPTVFGLAVVLGAGWALVLRQLRPRVWSQLGYGTAAGLADFDDQSPAGTAKPRTETEARTVTEQPLSTLLPAAAARELEQAVTTIVGRHDVAASRQAALWAIILCGMRQPEAVLTQLRDDQHAPRPEASS